MKKSKPHPNQNKPQASGQAAAVAGLELDARRTVRLKTAELLRQGRTPLHVLEAADQAAALSEQMTQSARHMQPPRPPLACQEGCAWCCHKRVGLSAVEVLRIIAYLRANLSAEGLEAVRHRLRQQDQERRSLAGDGWAAARLPCPLLVEQRCSIYPVRPLTCRGFNSSDARRCQQSVSIRTPVEVPMYEPQQRIATFVLDGTRAGQAEAGLSGELLELTAALRLALDIPDAAERWLAGEAVFAAAKMP